MAPEKFQIDTISISELGTAIVNAAQEEKTSPDPESLDNFHRSLDEIIPQMPHILQGVLTHFTTNFAKRYGDVLNQRIAIGHILLGAATLAEQKDVETANTFIENPPQALVN